MDLLPPAGVRPVLLDALAFIIRRRGYETFVRAPIVEPTSRYFPDPWEASERGVRVLSLRLLAYAGLEDFDASVEIDREGYEPADDRVGSYRHAGAAAWFWGIHEETCVFGCDRRQLDEADAIVGTMCHEIAHAYRRRHDMESTTRQIDEEQTDITSIYLGFGVLTVNNAHRYRTSGDARSMRWATTQTGYLSLQAMAYLFAAQCVARGLLGPEVARLGRLLEANQRECFEAARRELSADVDGLRARLGVPPEQTWPREVPFELFELREDALFEPGDAAALRRAELARRNLGRGLWRIASTSSGRFGMVGAIAAGTVAGLLAWRFEWSIAGAGAGAAALGAAAGGVLGLRFVRYACSDATCTAALQAAATERCPKCGGTLLGTLDDERDRLEAEDALAENRSTEELRRDLAKRRAKGTRWSFTVLVGIGLVASALAVLDSLPRVTTIEDIERDDPEQRQAKLALTGYVVESRIGTMALVGEDGVEVVPFRMLDSTGRMAIWYDPRALSPALHEGDHVRATGQRFRVSSDNQVRFIASSVKRVP
jgi:hypothetical protein